jgi:hypothetical protein
VRGEGWLVAPMKTSAEGNDLYRDSTEAGNVCANDVSAFVLEAARCQGIRNELNKYVNTNLLSILKESISS